MNRLLPIVALCAVSVPVTAQATLPMALPNDAYLPPGPECPGCGPKDPVFNTHVGEFWYPGDPNENIAFSSAAPTSGYISIRLIRMHADMSAGLCHIVQVGELKPCIQDRGCTAALTYRFSVTNNYSNSFPPWLKINGGPWGTGAVIVNPDGPPQQHDSGAWSQSFEGTSATKPLDCDSFLLHTIYGASMQMTAGGGFGNPFSTSPDSILLVVACDQCSPY